ncbi:MAG: hypothetical protein LBG60_05695 [Bifidobacteriaceae bacterium]|jgi:hypothetical protein|nr:hypothetical protein [Bifidobacteriaceae bacterium]
MGWLTGTSGALRRAREDGARRWKYPLIGLVLMAPLAYAIPVASFAAAAGFPGVHDKSGGIVPLTSQWLIGLTILLIMFVACGVIAYRLFGWPAWAALVFAVGAPVAIDLAWVAILTLNGSV